MASPIKRLSHVGGRLRGLRVARFYHASSLASRTSQSSSLSVWQPMTARHCKKNAAVNPPLEILLARFRSLSALLKKKARPIAEPSSFRTVRVPQLEALDAFHVSSRAPFGCKLP